MAQWSVDIGALAQRMGADVELVARKATLDVFTNVLRRSPVDTGRFRANWNVSKGAPDLGTTESTTQARGTSEVNKVLTLELGGTVYLSNSLPYSLRLEHGYSKQAPSGMVRLSAQQFSDSVKKAATET